MNLEALNAMTDVELRFKASELMGITDGAIPDYPNDISAAAGLIRWAFKNKELYVHISQFYNSDWDIAMGPFGETAEAVSSPFDRPGLAITRAFIMAMESTNAD